MVYFPVAIGVKAVLITTFLKDCKSHNLTILLASSSPFVTLSRMAVDCVCGALVVVSYCYVASGVGCGATLGVVFGVLLP